MARSPEEIALASVPDAETAALFLARLRQEAAAVYARIVGSPVALRGAASLFSYSRFLSEAVLREPERLLEVTESADFHRVLSAEEYERRLLEAGGSDFAGFRRRQLLRIALRDVLGEASLADVTLELSNLADAILDAAYRRVRAELVERYGTPRLEDGGVCGFSVISLGKLGGQELNYSSDIDLMFVFGGNGHTDGAESLSNKEFWKKVASEYTALLSAYTAEGQCYRVDLRLRPDGTLGEIAISEEAARDYYSGRARDWEKQMLIKARVSAGEVKPGAVLLEFVEPLIYQSSLDFRAVEAVSETRQRISEKMAAKRRGSGGLDIKLAPGGIRDIEFLAQCLQRLHGGREPWVRHGGTMLALGRLRDKGLLSVTEYARLATAYAFLRHLEHRLQLEEDRQTHKLPTDSAHLELLAKRMPGASLAADSLQAKIREHLAAVSEIYEKVIHEQRPLYYTPVVARDEAGTQVGRLLPLSLFVEKTGREPDAAVRDIFGHSSFLADELLRDPELVEEIGRPFEPESGALEDAAALRRYYRRQMLRIQFESVLRGDAIFTTLEKTSMLADLVINAAYRIAVREAGLAPDRMMTIALGRLGMREFDLGSDADLVFVIPDEDAAGIASWTGVAERMIHTISSYTGEGVMFSVDTRLRPNGREGDLVQSESAYLQYFAERAEAWEGITYMKSRAVAGNLKRSTHFLHELQQVDWRRYGQSMRSRSELAEMRHRLEREQGPRNPLKAGMGGYYDIDFALMYLRLKGAGIFYKVLNTPARIDVIEGMGLLPTDEAHFLREAATFYRAIDHGQRISTGHAEGTLPRSQAQIEVLADLVRRWTPEHLHQKPLEQTLREIRGRTRAFFDRLFGSA